MRKCRCQTADFINTKFRHGGISKDIDGVAFVHVCKYFGRKAIEMRHWAFLPYDKRELCFLRVLSFSRVNFLYLIFFKRKIQDLFAGKALCLEIFFFVRLIYVLVRAASYSFDNKYLLRLFSATNSRNKDNDSTGNYNTFSNLKMVLAEEK